MADRIRVSAQELEAFARQIDSVRSELMSAVDRTDGSAFGLESTVLLDALDDFTSAWSDRRRELLDQIQDAADVLRNAVVEFTAADDKMAAGVTGKGSEGARAAGA